MFESILDINKILVTKITGVTPVYRGVRGRTMSSRHHGTIYRKQIVQFEIDNSQSPLYKKLMQKLEGGNSSNLL